MMGPAWKSAVPLLVWLTSVVIPHPAGLTAAGWHYLALFAAVIVALVLEPIPASAVGLVGITVATTMGYVFADPAESIKWGLGGFSDGTVWLIFGSLVFSTGYEKTGLGRRIALTLVKHLGKSTLGLGYAVMLADLLIAPFTPSNTGRSAGVVFPIVRGIPPLYDSAPGASARRIGGYLMWTAFASTAVTSTLFLTALAPNLLATSLIHKATGASITWPQWLEGSFPIGLILLALLPYLVFLIYPPEIRSSREVPAWAASELDAMGRFKADEAMMGLSILLALVLWIFGGAWIHATTVVLVVVTLMILTRIIAWDDVIGNRSAWDTLLYFATLLTLAEGLNRVGVVAWVAQGVSSLLSGYPPLVVMALLVAFFFVIHYLFASLTAHTTAVLPALLAAGMHFPGMPVRTFALLLAYAIGLMGVISPYATGPAPVYYGSGYIPRRDFWLLGLVFGMIFLAVLLGVGMPYLLWLEGGRRA
jgi:L-tartrate/succinate antiporter